MSQLSVSGTRVTGRTTRPSSARRRTSQRVSQQQQQQQSMELAATGQQQLPSQPAVELTGPACWCCPVCAVLDDSASMLLLTDIWRGMSYTLGAFFDKKVTVGAAAEVGGGQGGCTGGRNGGRGGAPAVPSPPQLLLHGRAQSAYRRHHRTILEEDTGPLWVAAGACWE